MKRFVYIVFCTLFFVSVLTGCGEDGSPPKPMKFKIGQMIQTKLDGTKGQVITTYSYDRSYRVRFSRYSKYETRIFKEFELEKFNGERR